MEQKQSERSIEVIRLCEMHIPDLSFNIRPGVVQVYIRTWRVDNFTKITPLPPCLFQWPPKLSRLSLFPQPRIGQLLIEGLVCNTHHPHTLFLPDAIFRFRRSRRRFLVCSTCWARPRSFFQRVCKFLTHFWMLSVLTVYRHDIAANLSRIPGASVIKCHTEDEAHAEFANAVDNGTAEKVTLVKTSRYLNISALGSLPMGAIRTFLCRIAQISS